MATAGDWLDSPPLGSSPGERQCAPPVCWACGLARLTMQPAVGDLRHSDGRMIQSARQQDLRTWEQARGDEEDAHDGRRGAEPVRECGAHAADHPSPGPEESMGASHANSVDTVRSRLLVESDVP